MVFSFPDITGGFTRRLRKTARAAFLMGIFLKPTGFNDSSI